MIVWREHPHKNLITKLTSLKENNSVLWNGAWGEPLTVLATSHPKDVFSFVRKDNKSAIVAIFTLSDKNVDVTFADDAQNGDYRQVMTNEAVTLTPETTLSLEPWGYRVYIR